MERTLWRRSFFKASELLWAATEGQLSFGSIFFTDNAQSLEMADFILSETDRGYTTSDTFGVINRNITLGQYVKRGPLTTIHELGHHLWGLGEEYARSLGGKINQSASLPATHGNRIIPLTLSNWGVADSTFAGADVVYRNTAGGIETQTIATKSGLRITLNAPLSEDPRLGTSITVQWVIGVECTTTVPSHACVMEHSRTAAGTLNPDGTWTPAANPITEFCDDINHDPDQDTDQHQRWAKSCWGRISTHPTRSLLAPGGHPGTGTPAGYVPPTWIEAQGDIQLALVLDHSGSMSLNGGTRLTGVKNGAKYWAKAAQANKQALSIIWYNHAVDVLVSETDFATLSDSDVDQIVATIQGQVPIGLTDIRDGLFEGLNQMVGYAADPPARAAILLTDGVHNTPPGSSMLEAIAPYRKDNASIYTLGLGSGSTLDISGLERLAKDTGGLSGAVADGTDEFAIRTEMIKFFQHILGGLVLADVRRLFAQYGHPGGLWPNDPELPFANRPPLTDIMGSLGAATPDDLQTMVGDTLMGIDEVPVELGSTTAMFTSAFGDGVHAWLYLIDPDGNEIKYDDPSVIFGREFRSFEFASVDGPRPGIWRVVNIVPGNDKIHAGRQQTLAGIGDDKVRVGVELSSPDRPGPVRVAVVTRYEEVLTGLGVAAIVEPGKPGTRRIELSDADEPGVYVGYFDLPDGQYSGHVEVTASGANGFADVDHSMLHGEPGATDTWVANNPPFVRMVPIGFTIGRLPKPNPEEENRG